MYVSLSSKVVKERQRFPGQFSISTNESYLFKPGSTKSRIWPLPPMWKAATVRVGTIIERWEKAGGLWAFVTFTQCQNLSASVAQFHLTCEWTSAYCVQCERSLREPSPCLPYMNIHSRTHKVSLTSDRHWEPWCTPTKEILVFCHFVALLNFW